MILEKEEPDPATMITSDNKLGVASGWKKVKKRRARDTGNKIEITRTYANRTTPVNGEITRIL